MRKKQRLADTIPELDPEMLVIVEAFASAIVRIKKGDDAREMADDAAAMASNIARTRDESASPTHDDAAKPTTPGYGSGPKLLRIAEVTSWLSLSRGTIYRKVSEGSFPQPRKLGRSVRWLSTDIQTWVKNLPDSRS